MLYVTVFSPSLVAPIFIEQAVMNTPEELHMHEITLQMNTTGNMIMSRNIFVEIRIGGIKAVHFGRVLRARQTLAKGRRDGLLCLLDLRVVLVFGALVRLVSSMRHVEDIDALEQVVRLSDLAMLVSE